MITSEQISATAALLAGKQNIVIFTHVAPDGDALGSSLGLLHWLRSAYPSIATIRVILPTPYPPFLAWMPGIEDVLVYSLQEAECQDVARAADLAFCLDFNEPKRTDAAAPLLTSLTCPKILIDHHLHPDSSMAQLLISYPEAPAASFLVLDLINLLATPEAAPEKPQEAAPEKPQEVAPEKPQEAAPEAAALTQDAAVCLYTGLMTDTGNFAYNSNSPELYCMIAELLRAGINKDEIFDRVFNQFSVDRLRFTGYCLYHKMRIFAKYHTALIALSADELRRFNFQSGDAEGIVNLPLQIAHVKYSVFMREDVDKIKMSFRSQGDRPVNILAAEIFHGGGHKNAAGGESHLSLADTVKLFEDNYQSYFSKE